MTVKVTLSMHTVRKHGSKIAHIITDSRLTHDLSMQNASDARRLVARQGYMVACGDVRMTRFRGIDDFDLNPDTDRVCKACVQSLEHHHGAVLA